ncbi:MAG: hypothetical protein FWE67_13010, partial [Planctomycetaceae bacterium]|nr:hypothetical protein [Planctomycetaceae bacterium]
MYQFNHLFPELLKSDRRYRRESYVFVCEALEYAQRVLKLGRDAANEPMPEELLAEYEELQSLQKQEDLRQRQRQHISGQDLCWAARDYAVRQYGPMAETVLSSLGIRKTDDIGEIVYNLISIGQMRKTAEDSRDDFNGVFDF